MNLKRHVVEKKLKWYQKQSIKMTASTALEILSGILATQGGITGAFTAGVVHSRLMGYHDKISAKLASFYDFGAEFLKLAASSV